MYTYDIRSVVGVYTPVGVVPEWLWSVHSKLECTLRQGKGFFNDIFHNFALLEFYFLNMIYILLYIDFILSIFFQHSNILTRASHH